jgi:hypothetical protein
MKMKKKMVQMSLIVLSILMIGFNAWGLPSVSLVADSNVTAGSAFNVSVIADGVDFDPFFGSDLLAFGFDLVFDSAEFTFNSATVGLDFMDDSSTFSDTDVAGSAFPTVSGDDILLATLNFTALTDGFFSLGIFSDIVNDLNEGLITLSMGAVDITGDIEIAVSNAGTKPIPEPSTIILVFMGFAGMAGIRKFRK